MKSPNDLFGRLPTVNDLLENPRIKGLVDRVQEMEVAAGVRQFVDRMRHEVSRRALDAPIPSISELADRAARFILGRHAADEPQVINATGQLWPGGLTGPPLADEALGTLMASAQHYHAFGESAAERLAAEVTGAPAARLFNSPSAATLLALRVLADGKPVAVARGELGTLDGLRLTDLAEQAGVVLHEVGAADSVSIDDYRQALQQGAGVLLRIEAMPYALRGLTCRPAVEQLVEVASPHQAKVLHNIGRGPLADLTEAIPLDVATASKSLAAGVPVVIARGDGYTGGPTCGIAVGRRELVDQLAQSPLASVLKVDPLVERAMAGTLAAYRDRERAALAIPTLALLSTPLLNLESRAERIAAQIAEQPGIVSAAPIEIPAGDDMGATRPLPSYGVSVVCEAGKVDHVSQQLEDARPRVRALISGDRILLDLRSVFPDEDISLVAAFRPPETHGDKSFAADPNDVE